MIVAREVENRSKAGMPLPPTCRCAHLRTLHARRYPSQLAPLLYLGDWSHAEAVDRHAELGIKAVGSWDGVT